MSSLTITEQLRGLVLSAVDIKKLTDWPSAMIEDYLNIIDSLSTVATSLDDLLSRVVEPQMGNIREQIQKLEELIFSSEKPTNELKAQVQELESLISLNASISVPSVLLAAGVDGEVQYNDGGVLGADANFSWNSTTKVLTLNGTINIPLDDVGITFGADAPNASIYFDAVSQTLFIEATQDDESNADTRVPNGLSVGSGINLDNNTALDWGTDKEGWLQASDGLGFFMSSKNGPLTFRTGVNGTTDRVIISADGDFIFNPSYNDDDFIIRKETAGDAVKYDAGDDTTSIGDGGTTNFTQFAGDGEITLHGTARVINHKDIAITMMKRGVGSPPGEGLKDGFPTLDFAWTGDEEVFFEFHTPSRFDTTADMQLHIAFFVDTAPAAAAGVCWGVEWKVIEAGDTVDFTAGTDTLTDVVAITTGTPANDAVLLESEGLVGGAGAIPLDALIKCRLYRDVSNAGDTFAGDARLMEAHVHYISNKLGRLST